MLDQRRVKEFLESKEEGRRRRRGKRRRRKKMQYDRVRAGVVNAGPVRGTRMRYWVMGMGMGIGIGMRACWIDGGASKYLR